MLSSNYAALTLSLLRMLSHCTSPGASFWYSPIAGSVPQLFGALPSKALEVLKAVLLPNFMLSSDCAALSPLSMLRHCASPEASFWYS